MVRFRVPFVTLQNLSFSKFVALAVIPKSVESTRDTFESRLGVGKTPTRGRGRGQLFNFFKKIHRIRKKIKIKNLYKRVAHFELKKASPSQKSRELDPSISSKV